MIRIAVRRIGLLLTSTLLLMVGMAYGFTSAPVTQTNLQSLNGIVLNITGGFSLSTWGLVPGPLTLPAASSCTWGSGTVCNTALMTGTWQIFVVLKLNTVPATNTGFTISVGDGNPPFTQGVCAGACFTGTIAFTVPSSATAGSTQSFQIDTGSTTLPSPQIFMVVVF